MNARNTPIAPLPNPGEGGPVGGSNVPNVPVTPLPNPGEGGPVAPGGGSNVPVIPLPNPGEGGPVAPGGGPSFPSFPSTPNIPIIPLPNPGEGGPVAPGGGGIAILPWPRSARVRFLNAAYGYNPFRILINNYRVVRLLNYGAITTYGSVPAGYQTVTVTGTDGYVYLQKSVPFQVNTLSTLAVINTANGLDLLQIPDNCCPPAGNNGTFRVSNLAYSSGPIDVLLADGRVVFSDVRFKETTAAKRIRPGVYQFFFAETNLLPMPAFLDIETLDSAFVGLAPSPEGLATLYLNVERGVNYTVFLLATGSSGALQTMVVADR